MMSRLRKIRVHLAVSLFALALLQSIGKGLSMSAASGPKPLPPQGEVLEILESSLLSGGSQRNRFFTVVPLGIRFWIPWRSYHIKNRKQVDALLTSRPPYHPWMEGEFVGAFFPTDSEQILVSPHELWLPETHQVNTDRDFSQASETIKTSLSEIGLYVPYMVVWYHIVPELTDQADFRAVADRLAHSVSKSPKPKGTVSLIKSDWARSKALFELGELSGLKRRLLAVGIKRHLVLFGLYYRSDDDGKRLWKVADSFRAQRAQILNPSKRVFDTHEWKAFVLWVLVPLALLLWAAAFYELRRKRPSAQR